MAAIVKDSDGFIEAVLVDGPDVLEGTPPRYPGQTYSGGYEFHECIPKRYIDGIERVTGLHCDLCGFIWTHEPLDRPKPLPAGGVRALPQRS